MDFPTIALPPPTILLPHSIESQGLAYVGANAGYLSAAVSTAWPAANKAYFYPFRLTDWAILYGFWFWVGATQSGNVDVALFDREKNLVAVKGSTAMSATVNTIQGLDVADQWLPPGDYLLGGWGSSATGTCFGLGTGDESALPQEPIYEQAGLTTSFTDPAVPVICTDATVVRWAFGLQLFPTF